MMTRLFSFGLWTLLAGALWSAGGALGQETRILRIDDWFSLHHVGDPRISPDGTRVAHTVRSVDVDKDESETSIWIVPTGGGDSLRMTAPGYSASEPRWSPDGRRLSFLATRGEEEKPKSQVWAFDLRGGDAQRLTSVAQGIASHVWSPDSKRLALVMRDPEQAGDGDARSGSKPSQDRPKPHVIDRLQFKRDNSGYLDRRRAHIYVFEIATEKIRQLTGGDYDDSQPAWRPDGHSLAFVSNRSDEPDANANTDLWLIDLQPAAVGQAPSTEVPGDSETLSEVPEDSNERIKVQASEGSEGSENTKDSNSSFSNPRRLTTNPGSDHSPAWSPDGSSIAYITTTQPEIIWYATSKVATVGLDLEPPSVSVLTEDLDRHVQSPRWAADGLSIFVQLEDRGASVLGQIDLSADEPTLRRPIDGELSISAFTASPSGKIALLESTPHRPPEVVIYDARGKRKLSGINDELLAKLRLGKVEKAGFLSADGTELEAFLTFPPDFAEGIRYPTLLRIHGGPVAQYDYGFDFDSQLFAAAGYLVVRVNPRGSSGYGQDFSEAIWADWGNKDYEDVIAGVDHAVERGFADPERLGVGGWSYGGILTNYVISKTDRFKAATTGASEVLYVANYGHDHYQRQWEMELGLPWENRDVWERLSPFNSVEKIATPTLILGGALDWNVPILNSEQLYQALRRLGTDTELIVYPGEHHGIRRPSFQRDRLQRYLDWYAKYLR